MSQAEEIRFFNNLARDWWDLEGPQAMLHKINPLRVKWISRYVELKGLKVLDVGCGAGILSEALAQQGAQVTGIDLGEELIEVARHHAKESHVAIDYKCMNIEAFAKEHEQAFDCVTCLEMLEHVENFEAILLQISKVLKQGGKLFVSTLDRTPRSFLEAIVAAEYVLKLVPAGTHHYNQFIRPDELCAALRGCLLEPINIEGLRYHPLVKSFSIVPQPQTNYLVVAEKKI